MTFNLFKHLNLCVNVNVNSRTEEKVYVRWQLTVKVAVAAAGHEIIKHVEWKQRIFELAEVQFQNAGDRVDVLSFQLLQQRVFT